MASPDVHHHAAAEKLDEKHDIRHDSPTGHLDMEEPEVTWRAWGVVFSVAFGYLAMVTTLAASGFWATEISGTIGGATIVLWLSQCFQVIQAVVGPPFSYLGDHYGRKWIVLFGAACGIAGNAIIASASSMGTAIAGAAVFGIFFAQSGNVFAIISEVLPRRARGVAQGINGVGGNLGAIMGTLTASGFITNYAPDMGWRYVFYMSLAFHGIFAILFFTFYHPVAPPRRNIKGYSVAQRVLRFDIVGSFLLAASLVPLMMALIWGGVTYPWSSSTIIALLVVGCVMLLVLAAHQIFIKKDGLFAHSLWRNRNATIAVVGIFVEGMVYIVYNQFYGETTAILYQAQPTLFAARFAAFPICSSFAGLIYGWISYRYKTMKPMILFGYSAFLIGTITLASLQANKASDHAAIFATCIAGTGFGAPINLLVSVCQLAVPAEHIGLISALSLVSRAVGGALGTAIANAVFQAKIAAKLPAYVLAAGEANGVPRTALAAYVGGIAAENATLVASLPAAGVGAAAIAAGQQARLDAFADSLRFIWIVIIPFIVLGLVLVLFLRPINEQMNNVYDRPVVEQFKHTDAAHVEYRPEDHIRSGTATPRGDA